MLAHYLVFFLQLATDGSSKTTWLRNSNIKVGVRVKLPYKCFIFQIISGKIF